MIVTTYDLLTGHPFLAGLDPAWLTRLSSCGHRSVFHAGSRIFAEGGRATRFWLIRQGHIALDTQVQGRGEVIVETLGAGTVLGWSWMFPPYQWHFGASAVDETLAVELDGECVRRLCDQEPALGYELTQRFMAVVVERLQATRIRLLDIYQHPGGPA